MRKEAEQELNDLYQNSISVFCTLKRMKKGRMCNEKGAQEEETDDWVLLKKRDKNLDETDRKNHQ